MPKKDEGVGDELRRGEQHLPCRLTASEVQERMLKLARLAKTIRDKSEERPVEVVYYIKAGQITLVRSDTGEVIGSRAATPGELQMSLPEGSGDA